MFRIIQRSWGLLGRRERLVLLALGSLRVVVNLLDVLAIALVGLIAAVALGSIEQIPLLGEIGALESTDYLWFLSVVGVLFVGKSGLSLFLSATTYRYLARIEGEKSAEVALTLFGGTIASLGGESEANTEWRILRSTKVAFYDIPANALTLVGEASLALFVFVLFLVSDWQMAAFSLLYFGLILASFQLVSRNYMRKVGDRFASASIDVISAIRDLTRAFREIRVSGQFGRFYSRVRASRIVVARAQADSNFVEALPRTVVELALILGAIAFVSLDVLREGTGQVNFSSLGILIVGSLRITSAMLPMQRAFTLLRFLQPQAAAAQDFLSKDLQIDSDSPESYSQPQSERVVEKISETSPLDVEFNSVYFSYSPDQNVVLSDVSFKIQAGTFAALIGPSGAGKSTVVDLMLGLNKPSRGNITVGGLDVVIEREALHRTIGYVPQRPGLIRGTIRDNVMLGLGEYIDQDELIWKSLEEVNLRNLVESLPDGLDCDLGSMMGRLSGGELQRIGLARALITTPSLLVLDEATSGLDAENEAFVTDTLKSLSGDVTRVVVAHRLSTVQNADQTIVIEDGKILGTGTFSEVRKSIPIVESFIELMKIRSHDEEI